MKKNIIYFTLVAILVISVSIYFTKRKNSIDQILFQLNSEFPMMTIDDEVIGKVSRIIQPNLTIINNNPNQAYVLINNSLKINISVGFEIDTDSELDEILKKDDLLIKKYGQEEVLILRIINTDTLVYRFELADGLGYPLKKRDNDNL